MIYKKDANFPYPMLSSNTFAYEESDLTVKIEFEENGDKYRFKIVPNLTSEFIKHLLNTEMAGYVLVIQSKDTKFFPLKLDNLQVELNRNRMSLSSRTSIQLHVVSKTNVNFSNNMELNSFYNSMKQSINVSRNTMLGFSNIVTFEGGMKKPADLFEKRLNPQLKSAIKFELGSECIVISFREEKFQFQTMAKSSDFLNPYLYTGLYIALTRFITTYSEEKEDIVELSQITEPEDLLDFKLYHLMVNKMVTELSSENIDEVIARISHQLIEKYADSVKELAINED